MKDFVEISYPFTSEHLELGYSGKILKCGDWYIFVCKNRGRIPWIVNMSRFVKEDKEFNLGWIIDHDKEDFYTNDYSEGAVDFVNKTINSNRQTKIANKMVRELRIAKNIFANLNEDVI